jgi:hypothetical protein
MQKCRTIIIAVLMVMSDLDSLWNRRIPRINLFMLYINLVYMIMWLFGACAKFLVTQLLKSRFTKS